METLLWQKWDKVAQAKGWGIKVGDGRTLRMLWADDNFLAAENVYMLRAMLREMDSLLGERGMSADWGDTEKCSWIASDPRAPTELNVGTETISRVPELHILGRLFNLYSLEETTLEDNVTKAWQAFWSHWRQFRCPQAGVMQRMCLLQAVVLPHSHGAPHHWPDRSGPRQNAAPPQQNGTEAPRALQAA